MLKLRRSVLPLLLVAALAVACDDDDNGGGTTGPTVSDLAGTWVMTQGTLNPDAAQLPTVDLLLITAPNAPTLVIQNNGDFTLTLELAAGTIQVTGSIDITGPNTGTVTTDADPTDPADATFNLSGNTLTINVPDAELIDLTGDGQVTEADSGELNVTFQRQ